MNSYLNQRNWQIPTQREPDHPDQIQNAAGGYGEALDKWDRLNRWLALGSEGGTYYVKQSDITLENIRSLQECIAEDGERVVNTLNDMRFRVPKRDQIIYALALTFATASKEKSPSKQTCRKTVKACFKHFNHIIRTGTDLFMFVGFVDQMRGWGRSLQRLVSGWYENKASTGRLEYQMLKYQQRGNWSHKDVLTKCHYGKHSSQGKESNDAMLRWAVDGGSVARRVTRPDNPSATWYYPPVLETSMKNYKLLRAFRAVRKATSVTEVCGLIDEGLTHEMVPSQWLKSPAVWERLLHKMPMTAMIRNLGRMTSLGVLKEFEASEIVPGRLEDAEYVQKSGIHPIQVLMALTTYEKGSGMRGSLEWTPVQQIVRSLHKAFYASFKNVKPSGKNTMLAIDVSSSMDSDDIGGFVGLTPATASAAIALAMANAEPKHMILGFTDGLRELGIYADDSLPLALRKVKGHTFGRTDCALPMTYASQKDIPVESFVILTDNETWAGSVKPHQALKQYRERNRREISKYAEGSPTYNAKKGASEATLAIVAMTSTGFSIADPNDKGMLDVVGFDSNVMNMVASHARGEF